MKVHSAQGLTVMNTGDMHIKGVTCERVSMCFNSVHIFILSL